MTAAALRINRGDHISATYSLGSPETTWRISGAVADVRSDESGYRDTRDLVYVHIALDAPAARRETGELLIMTCRATSDGRLICTDGRYSARRLRRAS